MVVQGLTRLTRKGQLTLPANVRRAMGLAEGDRIEVDLEPDGTARLRRARSVVEAAHGALRREGQPAPRPASEERRIASEARGEYLARKHAPPPA
jgi:AbrB family looped-hinge helix DNA binding protein